MTYTEFRNKGESESSSSLAFDGHQTTIDTQDKNVGEIPREPEQAENVMKQSNIISENLWHSRRSGTFCDPIPNELTLSQAYDIQNACTTTGSDEDELLGYKIGATANETLEILGLNEPFYGPIYKSAYATNNGLKDELKLDLHLQHKPRVEAEFVACMKNDFHREDQDVTLAKLEDHIDWIAPGLEFVASRFSTMSEKPGATVIADFGANQYMVVGEPCHAWQDLDLEKHPVQLDITNQETINGHSGISIYGHPLKFVCWLLNQPNMHKLGLKAGQLVSCGTCTGAPFVQDGDQITAEYGTLGRLAVKIGTR